MIEFILALFLILVTIGAVTIALGAIKIKNTFSKLPVIEYQQLLERLVAIQKRLDKL